MQFSGRLYNIQGDVTNAEDVSKIVKWTRSSLGGVDVLVNSAGVFDQAPLRSILQIYKNFKTHYLWLF
jgi:3-oxoacyl-[acyl-carrier protein] reductase